MSSRPDRLVALIIARATTLAYRELLPELAGALQEHGYNFVLKMIDHESGADRAMAEIAGSQVGGIIAAARPSERELSRGCCQSNRNPSPFGAAAAIGT